VTQANTFMKPNQKAQGFTLVDLMILIFVIWVLGFLVTFGIWWGTYGNKGKAHVVRISCINNLKQVGMAYRIWAGEHQDKLPTQISVTNGGAMEAVLAGDVAAVFQVMSNELNTPKILFCPADTNRIRATTFDWAAPSKNYQENILFRGNTNLTYFVGLDANATSSSLFLSGDDNFLVGGNQTGRGGWPPPAGILLLATNTPVAWNDTRHRKQGNVGLADGSVQQFSNNGLRQGLLHTGLATNRLAMP
jgi:prepilin-type processing-associated H-X9-DG protein